MYTVENIIHVLGQKNVSPKFHLLICFFIWDSVQQNRACGVIILSL